MSTTTNSPSRGHRHTRSAAKSSSVASSQYSQNSQRSNLHVSAQNTQNEISMSSVNQTSHPATPPRTPRKDNQTPAHSSSTAPQNGSKQRSRNKNRPKNVMTSPPVVKQDRNTSPLAIAQTPGAGAAKSMNTPSTAAYAGPTFHASPAPSALPIPSFYSKSVPDSPGAKKLKSSIKEELATTPTTTATIKSQFQRDESPLDLFFKADREEKARARSASSAQTPSIPGPFQPPAGTPHHSQTPPFQGNQSRTRPGHKTRISSSGMFAMELDGESDPGTPFGPAFSTPYAQRINAAKSGNFSPKSLPQSSELQSTERSEALKAYLFSGPTGPSPPSKITSGLASPPVKITTNEYSAASTVGGPKSASFTSRSSYFSQIYGSDSTTSNNIPRTSGRTSGLRQVATPTKSPQLTPERYQQHAASPNDSRYYDQRSFPATNGFINNLNSQISSPSKFSTHENSSGSRNADLQGMEDSLRKLLKLDPKGASSVAGLGRPPPTSISFPNYVGGRAPL